MKKAIRTHISLAALLLCAELGASALTLQQLKQLVRKKQKPQAAEAAAPKLPPAPAEAQPDGTETLRPFETNDENAPAVYFTRNISPDGLVSLFGALGFEAKGRVGVRINAGEPPRSYHLRPGLMARLVRDTLHGTLLDSNAVDGGCRKNSYMHRQVIKDRRFEEVAAFDILDEEGTEEIPATAGENLSRAYVGSHFFDYDSFVVLTHFSGDGTFGFSGAMASLALGFSSGILSADSGKTLIYSGGRTADGSRFDIERENAPRAQVQECAAEAAKAILDEMRKKGGAAFITVLNNLSADSDDCGTPAAPAISDIGICASLDPLALDQACLDLVLTAPQNGAGPSQSIAERVESRNGAHMLEHAQSIRLGEGSRSYRLLRVE